jgi:predicted glutamine amidotransferase
LFNAVHNNEHGYGVLIKANNKIQVIKDMPAKVDPDKIYKILKDNEDAERWVHLRNASAGEVHMDNVQPIQVYHSAKRDIYFMHNGTVYNVYVPDAQKEHIQELDTKKDSDSRQYALAKIAPLLTRLKGSQGSADLSDPFIQEVILNKWISTSGRAVLIVNDQPPLLLNSSGWEKIKDENGKEFLASNDDYFKEIKRGTLFNERKAEEEKKKGKLPAVQTVQKVGDIEILKYPPFERTISLSKQIVDILEEVDLFTADGFIAMASFEESEIHKLFKENIDDATTMFMLLTNYLRSITIAYQELTKNNKENKLEKKIEMNKRKAEQEVHVG